MRKVFLLFLGLFLLVSCSRDNDDTNSSGKGKKGYFVKYKINGREEKAEEEKNPLTNNQWQIMFSKFEEHLSGNNGNSYDFDLDGLSFGGNIKSYPLKKGSYTFSDRKGAVNTIHNFSSYLYDETTKNSYYYTGVYSNERTSYFTLNITQVGKDYVKGNFSGSIEGNLLSSVKSKTFKITEGEFYLPIEKEE